jgi:hypothetical protein
MRWDGLHKEEFNEWDGNTMTLMRKGIYLRRTDVNEGKEREGWERKKENT